eukprot:jgi/Tetstr1/454009/TSEL_040928.t1
MEGLFEHADIAEAVLGRMAGDASEHGGALCMLRLCAKSLRDRVDALASPERRFLAKHGDVAKSPSFTAWFLERHTPFSVFYGLTTSAAMNGDIPCLEAIRTHMYGERDEVENRDMWDWLERAALGAVETGRVDVLEWVADQGRSDRFRHRSCYRVTSRACQLDQLAALKWMKQSGSSMYLFSADSPSCISGHCLETYKWWHAEIGNAVHFYPFCNAVQAGNLEAVKWFLDNECPADCEGMIQCELRLYDMEMGADDPWRMDLPCCRHAVMAEAMVCGQTEIARWAAESRVECSDIVYDIALYHSREESLPVLDVVHDVCGVGIPAGLEQEADRMGRSHLARWVRSRSRSAVGQ